MQAPGTTINATAERKTFLLLMARALSTTSYSRPLSLPYPILGGGGERDISVGWRRTASSYLRSCVSVVTLLH